MTVEKYLPSSRLRPFIQSFLFIETQEERDNTVLPDTSMFMALRYRGKISIGGIDAAANVPAAVLSGIRDSSKSIHYHANTANLIISFAPGAATAFFHEPVNELYDQSVPTNYLKIAALASQLYISRDALEKRFRASIGTSPKHFSSILRLRRAIATHEPGKSL